MAPSPAAKGQYVLPQTEVCHDIADRVDRTLLVISESQTLVRALVMQAERQQFRTVAVSSTDESRLIDDRIAPAAIIVDPRSLSTASVAKLQCLYDHANTEEVPIQIVPDAFINDKVHRSSRRTTDAGDAGWQAMLDTSAWILNRLEMRMPPEKRRTHQQHRFDPDLVSKSLLIAIDDRCESQHLAAHISKYGIEVTQLLSEVKCSNVPKNCAQFDLAFIDTTSKNMNGLAIVKKLRERASQEQLPVIGLTSGAAADSRQECILAGANDTVPKSVLTSRAIPLMRIWLRQELQAA